MKIFVIGQSGCGKTPFAENIARLLPFAHITSSAWVRSRFRSRAPDESRDSYIAAITEFSIEVLRNDPLACVSYMQAHHDLTKNCVVEGVRNPLVFFQLFDPRQDIVVFLRYEHNPFQKTAFEEGVDVIAHYIDYAKKIGLIGADRSITYTFGRFFVKDPLPQNGSKGSLEGYIGDFSRRLSIALQ